MNRDKFEEWVRSVSADVGRAWPFLCTRTLRTNVKEGAAIGEWRFRHAVYGRPESGQVCDGIAPDRDVQSSHAVLWGELQGVVARVSVHGSILPGRTVLIHSASVYSIDDNDEADEFVANPFRGLLEFLKGTSFEEEEYALWETIATQGWMRPTGPAIPMSSSLVVNSPTCPSPGPEAGS